MLSQEGSLCGVHCVNTLLQGPFFGPVEMSQVRHDTLHHCTWRTADAALKSSSRLSRSMARAPCYSSTLLRDSGHFLQKTLYVIPKLTGWTDSPVWGERLL